MALHIMQWNCHGLRGHIHELKNFINNSSITPDVICVEETFLDPNHTPRIDGYSILRQDNPQSRVGGMAILLKEGINHTLLHLEDNTDIETLGVEIKTNNGKIKIINVYISPSKTVTKDQLGRLFPDRRSIIVGDFNAHNKNWKCSHNSPRGVDLEEVVHERDLVVLNTGQPTLNPRANMVNNSVIDLAITTRDIALRCSHAVLNTSLGSDHKVTITTVDEEVEAEDDNGQHLWRLNKANWTLFKQTSKLLIHEEIITDDYDETFNNFMNRLNETATSTIPKRNQSKQKRKYKPVPFWNDNCSKAIYERNRLRNRAAKTRDINDQIKYNEQNAKSKRVIADTARQGWEDYCGTLTSQTKLGTVWGMAKKMKGVKSQKNIPTLEINGVEAFSNVDKANVLAENYAKISSTENYSKKFRRHISKNDRDTISEPSLATLDPHVEALNDDFNLYELKQAIKGAKNHSTPGEDKIPYELLQHLHKSALKILLKIYNNIWNTGSLPRDWKHAIILPILKPSKDPTKPDSYRPISLTSCLCKIMERMGADRLQWFAERKGLLSKDQTGFRRHKSTIDQIIRLHDKIQKSLSSKEHVLGVFIDFEKAYDMLHIPTLMRKIGDMGVMGNMYKWVKDFLTDRTFQVKVGSSLSERHSQENGTPQGSVISSLLFLIMINDIPPGLDGTEISLFADDSALFATGKNKKLLEDKIQMSLNRIQNWCNFNGFKISISKTTAVLFTNEKTKSVCNLELNGQKIEMTESAKFLGVILDKKLTWKHHIEHLISKCQKRLNLMRAVSGSKWGASKKALLMIYRALIRPVLDYGAVTFCTANDTNLKKLEKIQNQALRICCGASVGTAIVALQNECGEMPLHLRWLGNSLKEGVKIITTQDHPAELAMHDHWTLYSEKYKSGKEPLFQRTKEFMTTEYQECKGPPVQKSPPWQNSHIHVDISLSKSINKKTVSPDIQKTLSLALIDRYKEHTRIYTDGSKFEEKTAAAIVVPEMGVRKVFRIADSSSVYAAELTAINEAIEWIRHKQTIAKDQFAIFTDSLSAAESLKLQRSTSRPALMNTINRNVNKVGSANVTVVWIPSHVGVCGNEEADTAAKEGLNLRTVNSTCYIERQELYSKIHKYIMKKWQVEYTDSPSGAFYKEIEPLVSTSLKYTDAPRGREVQITRLRLGKVLLNKWLHTMKMHPDGNCEDCKVPDTIHHLLLECSRKNISQILNKKCQSLGIDHSVSNLLSNKQLQLEVAKAITSFKGTKLL
jgi:ribonuclease HI